jgi:hypothetical protein
MDSFKLYEDEEFTLFDRTRRQIIFKPALKHEIAELNKTKNIITLNLTKKHFKDGAVNFADLNDEAYNLVNIFFNSLTFVLDKKKRLISEKKNTGAILDTTNVQQTQPTPEKTHFNGKEYIKIFIETLFSKSNRFKVAGFRLWIFDESEECVGNDLVTKGLYECLEEARGIQATVQQQLNNIDTNRRRNKHVVDKLLRRYEFTTTNSDDLFIGKTKSYFNGDDRLLHNDGMYAEDEEINNSMFTDPRSFLKQDTVSTKTDHTLSVLFCKEQAMIYHVEDYVTPQQTTLASYFSLNAEEINEAVNAREYQRKNPNRLLDFINAEIKDGEFKQFPFSATTYRIYNELVSFDLFASTPLPHRIDSILYTSEQRETALARIKKIDQIEKNVNVYPLGIHDVEYELTSTVLQQYENQMTDDLKDIICGRKKGPISKNSHDSFVSRITTEVNSLLSSINNAINKKKNYFKEPETKINIAISITKPAIINNSNKQISIDKRIGQTIGFTDHDLLKEIYKNIATGNMSYARPIIARYRPVELTIENVLKVCGQPKYDKQFMSENIYMIADSLNEYGYEQIENKYFDQVTGKIRAGKFVDYMKEKRAFLEAIMIEFWEIFFTHEKVSRANKGIRDDLLGINDPTKEKRTTFGMPMPLMQFNIQTRPYHYFKLWIYSYFTEHGSINHHYKTMDALFFAKFHHCRAYAPHAKDPKLNVILSGQGMSGKSHRLGFIKESCPTDVAEGITKWTNEAYNVNGNMNDMLDIQEEMSNKLVGSSGKPGKHGSSEATNDDAKNNYKERATANSTTTISFHYDEESGERRAKLSKCQCQSVILGATNNDLTDADPNVLSRFIVISVPRPKNDSIGTRPQDKTKLPMALDSRKSLTLVEQQRELHRVYFMVESLIKAGVLKDSIFGVNIDSAKIQIDRILDVLQSNYGVATNDIRKRKHVLEMARCKCIAYAVWFGLTSPTTRHLQYDPYTNKFIGFNPRVLLDGILPHLVVTKDMVIDALTTLSCLWGHEYMDRILENIAGKICGLDSLNGEHFLRKMPDKDVDVLASYSDQNKAPRSRMLMDINEPTFIIDYNYVVITGRSQHEIHTNIANTLGGDLSIAANDISKILRDLSRTYIETDGYVMTTDKDGQSKLTKSTDPTHKKLRKIVDYGCDPRKNSQAVAISVAYLKQKLPYLLGDTIIEDLTNMTHYKELDDKDIIDDSDFKRVNDAILRRLVINKGDNNETSLIKAIREVMETNTLEMAELSTISAEQEKAYFEDYADIHTGKVPWFTFVTSEHPAPICIAQLFPAYYNDYSKLPDHNKEISLVDKVTVIQLERRKDAKPFRIYNFNTVSPTAKSTLSIFSEDNETFDECNENETNPEVIEQYEELYYLRDQQNRFNESIKKRFKLCAESPVIEIDQDLDYISCKDHLRNIAYPSFRSDGRIVNYPPHVYMDLIDCRERMNIKRPFVPIYADIMDRINVTRQHIESQIGLLPESEIVKYSAVVNANYEENDIQSTPNKTLKRRSSVVLAKETESANITMQMYHERYALHKITKVVSSDRFITNKRQKKS